MDGDPQPGDEPWGAGGPVMAATAEAGPELNRLAGWRRRKIRCPMREINNDRRFVEALGHCGESLRDPACQLLDLLTGHGARLACFEHTHDEVESVLNACAMGLSTQSLHTGYGGIFDHFLQKGFSESDVRLIITTVKRDLEAIGIEVRRKPEYDERFAVDETSLQNFIESELQYRNPHALHRDVDSVSAVIRLRRGAVPRILSCPSLATI